MLEGAAKLIEVGHWEQAFEGVCHSLICGPWQCEQPVPLTPTAMSQAALEAFPAAQTDTVSQDKFSLP